MNNETLRKALCDQKMLEEAHRQAKIMFIKAQAEADRIGLLLMPPAEEKRKSF